MDKSFLTPQKAGKDRLKTSSKKALQKMTEATVNLVGNKITEKVKKAASKTTHEDLCKLTAPVDETDETPIQPIRILKEKCILPEK